MSRYTYNELVYSPGPEFKTGELLDFLEKNAAGYRDIGVAPEDRIVGLSTCVDAQTNGRAVLFGRLEKK